MAKILQNTSYASVFFGANNPGQTMYQIPRVKYMFYANFVVSPEALSMFSNLNKISNWQGGVSFKIRTVDKPSIDLQQRELNQYNRKRYAYTKTEYKPVNLSIYDTVDNSPLTMWVEYFNYYFGDARLKSAMTMGTSPVDPTFDDSTGWGLRPLVNQINFFTQLNVYSLYNREYALVTYLNPKVSSVDWGNHDTSSSDLEDFKMTVSYETVQYSTGTITPDLANQFGFDASPYIEPNYTPAAIPTSSGPGNLSGVNYNPDTASTRPNITSPSASVTAVSGISSVSYANALSTIQPGPATQYTYPTASGTPDTVYSSNAVGNAPSDQPIPKNYGLTGLPDGQLPNYNQYLPLESSDEFFPVSGIGIYNLLGSFGSFNFGGSRVRVALGSNYTASFDPLTGTVSYRPGVPDDAAQLNALPVRIPGQFIPTEMLGYHDPFNTYYGPNGPVYLTQYQQIQQARRRVQQGEVSLTVSIGNPTYDDYGGYTGYNQSYYQPVPAPGLSISLTTAAALSNRTVSGFGYLDDPQIYGGSPSDNLPPPVIYPYENQNFNSEDL
jgi:hypothetical protein